MRYFIDTEFYEEGTFGRLHPISVGIVAQDGREFYAELLFDRSLPPPDHFVRLHVLPQLCPYNATRSEAAAYQQLYAIAPDDHHQLMPSAFSHELLRWIGGDTEPEFYAYFADYDWVLFCQRFGTMVKLPEHFPMWCRDLKQMAWERGRDATWIKQHVPQPAGAHNALVDARWCAKLYAQLTQSTEPRFLPSLGDAHGMFTAYDLPLEGIEVMAGALQAFLATPEGPQENEVSSGYRKVGRMMLQAMYRAKDVASVQPPRVMPAAL